MSQSDPASQFQETFSATPEWHIKAPGRINLIGEHVDYLDGFVMPAAIDRSLEMLVRANHTDQVRIWTTLVGNREPVSFSLSNLEPQSGERYWLNYIAGVFEMMRRHGIEPKGFDAVITADLPTGAGLSSSAALETVSALAMEAVTGTSLTPLSRAQLCLQAEQEFAGVPCGMMDQLAVGMGRKNHALLIDCRDHSVEPVPIPSDVAIVISDTQVKHALGDGEYRKRRENCEAALSILGKESWRDISDSDLADKEAELGELLMRRSKHVISEIKRVLKMRDALLSGNLEPIAEIMRSGHESLRDDYEVSCSELDFLVDAAYDFGTKNGLIGSRMTGGGFGGSTVSLVKIDAAEALKSHLSDRFSDQFNREPNCFIAQIAEHAVSTPFVTK